MPLEIACPQCKAQLRAPDSSAGKKIKCPKCQAVVQVPQLGTVSGAGGGNWYAKMEDGETYGPVPKTTLDEWSREGRFNAKAQVLKEGNDQWQWATDLYPELEQSSISSVTTPTVKPADSAASSSGFSLATGTTAATGTSGIGSKANAPFSGIGESGGASPAGGPRYRKRSYPAMATASKMYLIFGWIVIVFGGLGVASYLVMGITSAVKYGGLVPIAAAIAISVVMAIYAAITVVTLWFLSELIKAITDIEDNTHKTSHYLQQLLAEKQSDK